jgi:uncharacterized membrane protein YkvA (DUF1232 family)
MAGKGSDPMTSEELLDRAQKVSPGDIEIVLENAREIEEKSSRGPLAAVLGDIRMLVSMVRDYASRSYRHIPFWIIGASVIGLLYILNPMDAVPDFIPFLGFVDDAFVIGLCLNLVRKDLRKYAAWKGSESA